MNLSRQYNVEYFHLSNFNNPNIIDVVIIIIHSVDLGIEAEYEIIKRGSVIDGYVGQFKTKEQAIAAAEKMIAVYL